MKALWILGLENVQVLWVLPAVPQDILDHKIADLWVKHVDLVLDKNDLFAAIVYIKFVDEHVDRPAVLTFVSFEPHKFRPLHIAILAFVGALSGQVAVGVRYPGVHVPGCFI